MRDSQILMDIYKRYLDVTSDLVEILERHYEKLDKDSVQLKEKRKTFVKHAQNIIQQFHNDLHILFKISWELGELEKEENVK